MATAEGSLFVLERSWSEEKRRQSTVASGSQFAGGLLWYLRGNDQSCCARARGAFAGAELQPWGTAGEEQELWRFCTAFDSFDFL